MLLGCAAGLVAIFAGGIAGWADSEFVMETEFQFEPVSALAVVLVGIALTTFVGLFFAWRSLNAKPAQILRSQE